MLNLIFCWYVFTIILATRVFQELKNQMLELKEYKKKLMNALGEFLEEHFPLPEKNGNAKKKVKC